MWTIHTEKKNKTKTKHHQQVLIGWCFLALSFFATGSERSTERCNVEEDIIVPLQLNL